MKRRPKFHPFKPGDRVVFVGPFRGFPCPRPGTSGTVHQWDYLRDGEPARVEVAWDSEFCSSEFAHEIDRSSVVEMLARLA